MSELTEAQLAMLDRLAESIQALPKDRREQLRSIMERRALTINETAEVLGTHPETIRRMVREGSLRAVRLGTGSRSPYRISNEEIDRFLQEGPRPTDGADE
jgi:excisionase family DNA binding protein